MGTAASAFEESLKHSQQIDARIQRDAEKWKQLVKLLLLGSGECGKTTVLKQLRIIHDNGFTDTEVIQQRSIIRGNLLHAMTAILLAMEQLSMSFTEREREQDARLILDENADENAVVETIRPELSEAIQRLWHDKSVRRAVSNSHQFQLIDSAEYFLENIRRIGARDYIPTQKDILMARRKTNGVAEFHFTLKQKPFLVVDVGGQRTQRRKWIHCFENVNSILYVTAVSEYNQMMRETPTSNRLIDSIRLFGALANSKWFKKTHIIVFLNKIDLLAQKIKKIPITETFPDYDGAQNYEESIKYIEQRFHKKNRSVSRHIYCHPTCATETGQIQFVLAVTIDMVYDNAMKRAGLY